MPASLRRSPRDLLRAVREHFLSGIWSQQINEWHGWKAAGLRVQRILTAAVAEFFRDQCMLRASALTFYTLLSVVPVFAVLFGIAKGFGLETLLERELMEQLAGQQDVTERILTFSRNMLENTRGGLIAGVGVVVMLWSALKVLGQIESALNAMWDVRAPRSWGRRFSDYLTVMLLAPMLLLMAGSVSVFVRTQFDAVVARFEIVGWLGPLVLHALRLAPLVLVWALFVLIYMAMPNTRVRFTAAAAGAASGSLLYQLVQWMYIGLQVGVAKQNAIYGSFAALPLFLAWVQASWGIVLFGAEVCYAVQHRNDYRRLNGGPSPGPAERTLVALHITRTAVQRFCAGDPPLNIRQLAQSTGIPPPWVEQSISDLVEGGILSRLASGSPEDQAVQPAMDATRLTLQRVLDALQSAGGVRYHPFPPSDDINRLRNALDALRRAAADSPANQLLKDI
jgi:membrane protein